MLAVISLFGIALTTWLIGASVAVGAWSIIESRSQAKKAKSLAKKQLAQQQEQLASEQRYAGEYLQLSKEQMEMQSQQRQIDTLADLIIAKGEAGKQPTIFTLPPAKEYSAVDQINMAIGKILKG